MQKDYATIYQHTGCKAFTNKARKCKNKNQFCSTPLVIPVHQAFRTNIRKGDVSPLKNTDMQPDSGTNFHVFNDMHKACAMILIMQLLNQQCRTGAMQTPLTSLTHMTKDKA